MAKKRHLLLTRSAAFLIVVWVSVLVSGCGRADIGENCDDVGSLDDCESGAVCTNSSDGSNYCRKVCGEQSDCGASETCNGISGTTIKSCQPD